MKLHEAIKQLVTQFGESIISETRLANLVADLNGYEEFPAMKQVFKETIKTGMGEKLFASYKECEDTQRVCNDLTELLAKEYNYKKDLIRYGLECMLFALGCLDTVSEPLSKGYDAFSKGDEDLLNNLPALLASYQKDYLVLLDKLPTLPKDLLHEAPGYYSAEALTRLYAVEAKIIAISQHLEKDNSKWCLEKRQEKLSQFRKRKEDAVSKALITLKTDYQTQLHALIIIPVRLWIKRSGYYNEAGLKTLSAIEEDIKLSYYNLNMNYDNWCETERDKVLAQYKVSGSSIAAKIGIPAAIFMGVTGTGTSYLTSMGDIEQFEQNISLGEQSIEAGDYIKALTFFHDAKSEYNASFRSRHYEEIADKHISEGLDKLVEKSLDLINQGHLLEANKLLKSVPEETILTEDMSRLTNAREVLSKEVNNGIDNLIQNISQNKGHLDDKAKQQLEELLSLNPTDYWLNFLKTKEL